MSPKYCYRNKDSPQYSGKLGLVHPLRGIPLHIPERIFFKALTGCPRPGDSPVRASREHLVMVGGAVAAAT